MKSRDYYEGLADGIQVGCTMMEILEHESSRVRTGRKKQRMIDETASAMAEVMTRTCEIVAAQCGESED